MGTAIEPTAVALAATPPSFPCNAQTPYGTVAMGEDMSVWVCVPGGWFQIDDLSQSVEDLKQRVSQLACYVCPPGSPPHTNC